MSEKNNFYLKFDWMYVLWKVRRKKILVEKMGRKGWFIICIFSQICYLMLVPKLLIGVLGVIFYVSSGSFNQLSDRIYDTNSKTEPTQKIIYLIKMFCQSVWVSSFPVLYVKILNPPKNWKGITIY